VKTAGLPLVEFRPEAVLRAPDLARLAVSHEAIECVCRLIEGYEDAAARRRQDAQAGIETSHRNTLIYAVAANETCDDIVYHLRKLLQPTR
jgi:hypothetical protein